MTVLILDDQSHVIAGLMLGVHWEKCGVKRILKATSASEARSRLAVMPVDVLLCDIEMPSESGLELMAWMRQEGYTTECIVLTAHADFVYAQRALRLGSIDYILQPAPYDKVEKSLMEAIRRIEQRNEEKRFSSYGHLLWSRHKQLSQMILSDWFGGRYVDMDALLSDLKQLGIPIGRNTEFLCGVFCFEQGSNNNQILLESVLSDELGMPAIHILLVAEDTSRYQAAFFAEIPEKFHHAKITASLNSIPLRMSNDCGLRMMCKVSEECIHLGEVADELETLVENLPAFAPSAEPPMAAIPRLPADLGSTLILCEQYRKRLEDLCDQKPVDTAVFQMLYCDLLQALSSFLQMQNLSIHKLLGNRMDQLMNAYQSPDTLLACLDYIVESLKKTDTEKKNAQAQLDLVKQYIYQNIEKDLKRSEIAQAAYLSPSHLSRLFRMKMNITLKEFIITEKMKLAHTLLVSTSLPISVVASKVGYSNFSYFSQTYKRVWEVTPSMERGISDN